MAGNKFFFEKEHSDEYFATFLSKMEKEVERLSDSEIMSCDFQEWTDYLVNKYYIEPITMYESNIDRSLSEAIVKVPNPFGRYPDEPDYYEVEGVRITFKIPFEGDSNLFEIHPRTYMLSRFEIQDFVLPNKENCGSFSLSLEYTKQSLQEKGEEMNNYVQKQFEQKFTNYKTMIENINVEVESYNKGLEQRALQLLKKRKEKADSFSAISSALQIPMKVNKDAPNTKPIPLKRIVRKPASKPEMKPVIPESCISDKDYENINNIIIMCGTTMEKTARTYYANNEEELRDHLLATLNTHYDNATGETFRKIGKTDINIEFENKAAFIGECKIWHGEGLFKDAIQQVLSYSTWRDVKVSVIIFNKENRSFPDILKKIKKWVDENVIGYSNTKPNEWVCKYHRQDMNIDIQMTIMAFDLYVDKSQFKDKRFE